GAQSGARFRHRGVVVHGDRVFVTYRNWLYALHAASGQPIGSFGTDGHVDLLIMGSTVPETLPSAPGDIRAFDINTGKIRWSFHTIPHPGEFGYDTWPKDAWQKSGAANNWAGMTVDQKTGIVYVPTGSAAFDFYGGDRSGDNLFANCELALNAETGERIWHFQGVHHDIWDRDFPAPPVLVTVKKDGKAMSALAQTTKQGFLYLFDRATGKPLFQVESHKYPPSNL